MCVSRRLVRSPLYSSSKYVLCNAILFIINMLVIIILTLKHFVMWSSHSYIELIRKTWLTDIYGMFKNYRSWRRSEFFFFENKCFFYLDAADGKLSGIGSFRPLYIEKILFLVDFSVFSHTLQHKLTFRQFTMNTKREVLDHCNV